VNSNPSSRAVTLMRSPGLNSPRRKLGGQRVQQAVLDGALERAGAELRVEAFLGDQLLGRAVHLQGELLLRQAFLQPLQLDIHDAREVLFVQVMEDDDVVTRLRNSGRKWAFNSSFTTRSSSASSFTEALPPL